MKTATQFSILLALGLTILGAFMLSRLDALETARLTLVATTVVVTAVAVGLPAFIVGVMLGVARERNATMKMQNKREEFRRDPVQPPFQWPWPMLPPQTNNGVRGTPVVYDRSPESYRIKVIGGDQD